MSVGYFLNPSLIKCKKRGLGSSKTLGNAFLYADFFIDIDNKWENNLNKAISILRLMGFKEIEAYESPNGFHIWVKDFKKFIKKDIHNINDRESFYLKKQKEMSDILKEHRVVFDYGVSTDTRRIGRIPLCLSQIYGSEAKADDT